MRWMWLGLSACGVVSGGVEGDEADECRDGADNDQNGLFDCDDPGCAGSPDCEGTNPTVPTSSTTKTTSSIPGGKNDLMSAECGKGPPLVTDIASVDVTLTLDFQVDAGFQYLFPPCMATYVGQGDMAEAEGSCVTVDGAWALDTTDCSKLLLPDDPQLVWVDLDTEEAYHTLQFSDGGDQLDVWTAHGPRRHGVPSDSFSDQFWVTEISDTVNVDNVATYNEQQPLRDGALRFGTLDITLDVALTRD